jgi:acetylornithine deacetylase
MSESSDIRAILEALMRPQARSHCVAGWQPSLNDARFYDRHFGIPALCYGPVGERVHGFDERVNLASLRETTKTLAYFVAQWCGVQRSN